MQYTKFVGIDMAKNDFYACLDEIDEPRKFNNNTAGINSFISHLNKNNYQKDNTIIGTESTASYHLKLCLDCTAKSYAVKVINPLIVKKQNQTELRKVKNDKKDAKLIRFCLIAGAGYIFNDTADTITLKSIIRQRESLVSARIKAQIQQYDIIHKENCIKRKINPVYQELYVMLGEKIKGIETELRKYRRDEQMLLESIPGIGPITSASFISEVGDINKFKFPEQLVACIGLDPRVHESGESIRGKGYITKRGNKILRTRLYNACSVAVLHSNLFQRFFQKKVSEGKPYKVALVAAMRKMVHVIYSVWTRGTPFK